MESEKVKEIKKKLQEEIFIATSFGDILRKVETKDLQDYLTLINELESENYKLEQNLGQCENGYKLELHTARYQLHSIKEDLKKAEKRIAELEKGNEALSFAVKQGFNDCQKKTLKQFTERLKEKLKDNVNGANVDYYVECARFIDETLKEFIGDKND